MTEKNIFCYLMVAPAFLLTALLGIYPMISSLVMSFYSYDLLKINTEGSEWVGLANYKTILSDPRFIETISQTFLFTILAVAIVVSIGLFLAQIINQKFRGRAVLRTAIFSPWFVPPAVASAIWMWLLNVDRSPINDLLMNAGLIESNIRFLTDSDSFLGISIPMLSIVAVRVWNGLPFVIIFLLAGLQSIPKGVYDAAEMDGATVFQKFRYVTLPMLKPVMLVLLALLFMGGFGHFEMNYIMTGGGPNNMTNVLAVWSYQQGFGFLRFDLASAASGIILLMTSVICFFYLRLQSKDDLR